MRPTIIQINWSESGRWKDGDVVEFWGFEEEAAAVAHNYKTGGYLKTNITVHFDNGDTYTARIDLAAHDTHGFQHHIQMAQDFRASAAGKQRMANWPAEMRESWEHLATVWARMDFTRPAPMDAPREEATAAGIQYLIPGILPVERPTKRNGNGAQMSLF